MINPVKSFLTHGPLGPFCFSSQVSKVKQVLFLGGGGGWTVLFSESEWPVLATHECIF